MKSSFKGTRLGSWTAGAAVLALALTGCTTTAPEDDRTPTQPADSVPFGASQEEWIAAFEDLEPIQLRVQTFGPQGAIDNRGKQAWGDALEEYSGGKITIEWGYGNTFVPSATEQAIGLADGRHDAGNFQPYYNPDLFPKLAELTNATFLDGNLPTATLVSSGWLTDILYSLPEYQQEAEENGVHVIAAAPSANLAATFCKDPRTSLADFAGQPVTASGAGRVAQVSALGAIPQSIAFTELYEALERNVVVCGTTTATAVEGFGGEALIPHAVADPEAALVGFPVFFAVSHEVWTSLPLVAQQLMFDLLGLYLENEPKANATRNADWLQSAQAAGGGLKPLEEDARAAVLATNEGLLEEIAANGADTDAFLEAHARWFDIVNSELYPDLTTDLEAFLSGGAFDDVDLQPFIDRLYEEVLLKHRPS